MKKALLLVGVLIISVLTTACINNLAVQELNTKAKNYLDNGDYKNAIERLKSSIDLDNTIFESHYNLAVAYTKNEDYAEAIEAYNNAIKLNPDFADAYYSLAVCEENLALDIISGNVKVNEDNTFEKASSQEEIVENSEDKKLILTDNSKKAVYDLLTKAAEDYKIYIDKTTDTNSAKQVQDKIGELEKRAQEYKPAVKE
ncbi:tetratricopeptide repeat protein [bacterium]|nr:tetratricopeptide repeat protein [bacterium]